MSAAEKEISEYPALIKNIELVQKYLSNKKVFGLTSGISLAMLEKFQKNPLETERALTITCESVEGADTEFYFDRPIISNLVDKKRWLRIEALKTSNIETWEDAHALMGAIAILTKTSINRHKKSPEIKIEDLSTRKRLEFRITAHK